MKQSAHRTKESVSQAQLFRASHENLTILLPLTWKQSSMFLLNTRLKKASQIFKAAKA